MGLRRDAQTDELFRSFLALESVEEHLECEYGIMEDSLKILFPDSINARKFFNEAIELGFKRNKTYIPEGCSSLNDCAEYIDDHCIMVIRILSKKNNCVVVLHRLI